MPAYMIPIETRCAWQSAVRCQARASQTVYNRWNEQHGIYCTKHARLMVRMLDSDLPTTTTTPR